MLTNQAKGLLSSRDHELLIKFLTEEESITETDNLEEIVRSLFHYFETRFNCVRVDVK